MTPPERELTLPERELAERAAAVYSSLGLDDLTLEFRPTDRPGDLFVWVISSSFEGMDDVDRDRLIWDASSRGLSDGDRARIEFVFADTPQEAFA